MTLPHLPVRDAPAPDPWLRVGTENVLRPDDDDPAELEDVSLPVLELGFVYAGVRIAASDPRERFFVPDGRGMREVRRDRAAEIAARRVLESFGAVELRCLDAYEPALDSRADYLVRVDGDVHAYCSFAAYALPQLRALGWRVEIDEGYPYRVISSDVPWYVELHPDDTAPDWFGLELGVVIDGRRTSLLPALLDLLDRCPDDSTLSALLRSSSRYLAVPAGNGCWLPVPADRLRRVLGVLRDLYDGKTTPPLRFGERLRVPEVRSVSLGRLDDAFDDDALAWGGSPSARDRSRALAAPPAAPAAPPAGLRVELREYQRVGVAWLQHLRALGVGGVLADDMGLGKTLQTIAHVLLEKESGRMTRPALVVAPTSLVRNWEREIARFAPSLRTVVLHGAARRERVAQIDAADVVVTTYGLLARDAAVFEDRRFHLLVLDEAQAIKNRRSQAHRAVAAIDADQRICLSGTPIENRLDELFALLDVVVPGLFPGGAVRPIALGDTDRLADLRRRVAPFVLRRLKSHVARELPPKTELVRPVELCDEQRELYESIRLAAHADVRRIILKKGLAAATVPVLDALMKLRQVCCHPQLVRVPAARKVTRSAKLEVLLDLVGSQLDAGRRILLFSQFTTMLALVSEGLLARGIRHLKLTGQTADRQGKVDAFQAGRADVFLISLKAGGTGLTLTRADTVIHYDPWWNPAVQSQATDRAHRIGQESPVFVYNLIVAGSVEERMLQLQDRKRQLAEAILGSGQTTAAFDMEDVEDLFAPLDD
jgi:superfamily II DNA or RNA helicase